MFKRYSNPRYKPMRYTKTTSRASVTVLPGGPSRRIEVNRIIPLSECLPGGEHYVPEVPVNPCPLCARIAAAIKNHGRGETPVGTWGSLHEVHEARNCEAIQDILRYFKSISVRNEAFLSSCGIYLNCWEQSGKVSAAIYGVSTQIYSWMSLSVYSKLTCSRNTGKYHR